jgi:hypothetical protein
MRLYRYLCLLILIPGMSWGSTYIINQSYFLDSEPPKSWSTNDRIIVMGDKKVDIQKLSSARKKFPKTQPIYWMLSDDQWNYNAMGLNKDQKVIDFANQLQEIFINVIPFNLCPKAFVLQESTYDVLLVDSNWFLFDHQIELFTKQCAHVDIDKYYAEIEGAVVNAKVKPLIVVSHHTISKNIIYPEKNDPLLKLAIKVQQSLGTMDGISNPAYQRYYDKMNKMLRKRENVVVVSANISDYYVDENETSYHVDLSTNPTALIVTPNKKGAKVDAKEFKKPIQLVFNEKEPAWESEVCDEYTGSLYDFKIKGGFYKYFLGSNYRPIWQQKVRIECFNLEKEKFTVEKIDGSLRSPDFLIKDRLGNLYKLRPLKKEVRLPEILRETIVEKVLLDQQSALNPLGFMLIDSLSREVGLPTENPRLVYIDVRQAAFSSWKDVKFQSGFYQMIRQPYSLTKDPEWRQKGVIEVLSNQEMVHKLENESRYKIDHEAYLKVRLFDMLIGDWDRQKDQWYWMVIPDGKYNILKPFPVDRDAAFYHADGVVSWWRRRKWINYKLQDYARNLKHPNPMMIQSYSMDHRYTANLSLDQWNKVVEELQSELTSEKMEIAIAKLPIKIPEKEKQLLIKSYQNRIQQLPQIAGKMRLALRESVDIVGTSEVDRYVIQSGPGNFVEVTGASKGEIVFSDKFDSDLTKEIRIYGLGGDDAFKLNWAKYTATKVRIIPGEGNDKVLARDQKIKPMIALYDQDEVQVDSYHGFLKKNYSPIYNDYYSHVNQRKLNVLSPVLFLASSNADSGFVLGGGLKYYKEGFQHAPWASTNEIKANAVLNRGAVNIMYQGTIFDLMKRSDLDVIIEAGLPRFYGSFFGLGNGQPDLDVTFDESYYWMKARHLESTAKITVPIFQRISLIPQMQFRFRDYVLGETNFLYDSASNGLNDILGPGTVSDIGKPSYYLGTGLSFRYFSDDSVSGPVKKRIVRVEAKWMFQQGLAPEDGYFQTAEVFAGLTGFFPRSKTQWKLSGGYGANFGNWEFFDAQYLGQGQNLRGFFMNRFAGSSRIYDSLEINQSILWKKLFGVITDIGIGAHYDNGRVFIANDAGANTWHQAVGGQTWVTFLNSFAFKMGYSRAIYEAQPAFWTFAVTTEL